VSFGEALRPRLRSIPSIGVSSKFGDAESEPLLILDDHHGEQPSRAQLLAVLLLLWLYLVDKLMCEAWLTSVPIVTRALFAWSERRVGVFLCVVCALVLPASQLCQLAFARVHKHAKERTIIGCARAGCP
jgi:hypothetical protein